MERLISFVKNSMESTKETRHKVPRFYKCIPGPKPIPIYWNTVRFQSKFGRYDSLDTENMMRQLRDDYGEIVLVEGIWGQPSKIYLFDPALMESVFQADGEMPIRPPIEWIKNYKTENRRSLGLGDLQSEDWRQFRSQVEPYLMEVDEIKQYIPKMDEVAQKFVDRMTQMRDQNSFELPENFMNELSKWSLETISFLTLGHQLGCLESNLPADNKIQRMIDAIYRLYELMHHLENRSVWQKFFFSRSLKDFNQNVDVVLRIIGGYVDDVLKQAPQRNKEARSIAEALQRNVDNNTASVMLHDLMSAKFAEVANAMGSSLYAIATNLEVQERLYEELHKVLVKEKAPLTSDTLQNKLPYFNACLKEAMRLFPTTISISRITQKEIILGDYIIPKGMTIVMALSVTGKTEKYFSHPDSFIPRRWLPESEGGVFLSQQENSFTHSPYSHGARNCIGQNLAQWEMLILLIRVVSKFRLEYSISSYGPLEMKSRIFNVIKTPLKIKVSDR